MKLSTWPLADKILLVAAILLGAQAMLGMGRCIAADHGCDDWASRGGLYEWRVCP